MARNRWVSATSGATKTSSTPSSGSGRTTTAVKPDHQRHGQAEQQADAEVCRQPADDRRSPPPPERHTDPLAEGDGQPHANQ